jgi:hypothetical protein
LISAPTMIWPAKRPTPLSELPTGNDGLLHNAHWPQRDAITNGSHNRFFILSPKFY